MIQISVATAEASRMVDKLAEPPERLLLLVASTVWFVLGTLVGLFSIAMFGVFYDNKDAAWLKSGNFQDTVVALTAVIGAITGVFGVIFVAKTLRATALTLNSQVQMAIDQAKANKLEYQARLGFEALKLRINSDGNLVLEVGIKNYGRTEARFAFILAVDDVDSEENTPSILRGFIALATIEAGVTETEEIEIKPKEGRERIPRQISLQVSFINYDDHRIHAEPLFMSIELDENKEPYYTRTIPPSLKRELMDT